MKMGVGFFVFNRATTVRECTSRWMYLTEPRPSGSAHRDACIQQSHDRKGVHIEMHVFNRATTVRECTSRCLYLTL